MFEPHCVFFSSYCFGGEDVEERMGHWEAKVAECGTNHISWCAGSHRKVEFL